MKLESLKDDFDIFDSEVLFPSLVPVLGQNLNEVSIYVVFDGIKWESWLISLSNILGFKYEDESYAPTLEWIHATRDRSFFAYRCYDSNWLKAWEYGGKESSRSLVESTISELQHYAFLGGECNVEVLCCANPSIKRNDKTSIPLEISLSKLSLEEKKALQDRIDFEQKVSMIKEEEVINHLNSRKSKESDQ
ncbi:MAG: hypothetical protein AAF821_00230 [Cyanobacteria bacterium P01_D01_bin.156]